jgi:hypothetical protein
LACFERTASLKQYQGEGSYGMKTIPHWFRFKGEGSYGMNAGHFKRACPKVGYLLPTMRCFQHLPPSPLPPFGGKELGFSYL